MLTSRGVRRWARAARGGRLLLLAAAVTAALLAAALLPAPEPLLTRASFPRHHPRTLARLLADFTAHTHLYPHLGEWAVEEESGNYSAWRYTVSYRCGARCGGRATVLALDEHAAAPSHAPPPRYRVRVEHRSYWWETETVVEAEGAGGARLWERAAAACGALRRLRGACGGELRARRQDHLLRLRRLLDHGSTAAA